MKQSDIFTLILIAGIGTLVAFFVCQTLLGDPSTASVKFKAVNRVVSSSLTDPDPEVFNSLSINPTIEVYVGDCEDIDKNGILDDNELKICLEAKNEGGDGGEDENGDENQGESTEGGEGETTTEPGQDTLEGE